MIEKKEQVIDLNKIIEQKGKGEWIGDPIKAENWYLYIPPLNIRECMKELARQILELAAENARIKLLSEEYRTDNATPTMWDVEVDKESILDVIKLVQ